MTINQAITLAKEIKPSKLSDALMIHYINEIEGIIQTEVMRLASDEIAVYSNEHRDLELLCKPPHDKLYVDYLVAMTDFALDEYDKYEHTVSRLQTHMNEYAAWFAEHYRPADGLCEVSLYYLSAYGLAKVHGFTGTEEEWLASLKGDKGDSVKGDKGDPGKSAYEVAVAEGFEGTETEWLASLKGAPGKSYILTDSDKVEIAEEAALLSMVGRYATVPSENWSDDTDLLSKRARAQRIAYKTGSGAMKAHIADHTWVAGEDIELSESWATFEREFTYSPADYTGGLWLIFYGGKSSAFCHPYDIADVKLWLASDEEQKNLLPEDIANLNWWWNDPTESCLEVNCFSVAFDDDGSKYIHVWRQNEYTSSSGSSMAGNLVELRAATGVKLTEGETYVLSVRMRSTCSQHTAIAECEGIRDHSATVVSPVPTSTAAYLNNGVRAFGQRIGELMLEAETKPNSDITVGIQAVRGQGTGVIINNVMPEIAGTLDAALLPLIGEV